METNEMNYTHSVDPTQFSPDLLKVLWGEDFYNKIYYDNEIEVAVSVGGNRKSVWIDKTLSNDPGALSEALTVLMQEHLDDNR